MQGFSQKYSPRCNRYSRTFCPMSLTVFCNGRLRNLLYGGLWITVNKVPRRRDLGQIGWLLYTASLIVMRPLAAFALAGFREDLSTGQPKLPKCYKPYGGWVDVWARKRAGAVRDPDPTTK